MIPIVARYKLGNWVQRGSRWILLTGRVEDRAGRVLWRLDRDGVRLRDTPIPRVPRVPRTPKEGSE